MSNYVKMGVDGYPNDLNRSTTFSADHCLNPWDSNGASSTFGGRLVVAPLTMKPAQ